MEKLKQIYIRLLENVLFGFGLSKLWKETILNTRLEEKVYETKVVVVKAIKNKPEPMNKMVRCAHDNLPLKKHNDLMRPETMQVSAEPMML